MSNTVYNWTNELGQYKKNMLAYFNEYSAKLSNWYHTEGALSEQYRVEYEKYVNELKRYEEYIQQMEARICQEVESLHSNALNKNDQFDLNHSNVPTEKAAPETVHKFSTYYTQMISFFKNFISSLPESDSEKEDNETEKSDKNPRKRIKKKISNGSESIEGVETLDTLLSPSNVMREYHESFSNHGKWSFESWSSYLQMTARNNPDWFRLFDELSRSQGINWQYMYEGWLSNHHDNPTIDPNVDKENQNFFDPEPPQSVALASPMDEEDDDVAKGEDGQNNVYCKECSMAFESDKLFMHHLRGLKHMQNALKKAVEKRPHLQTAGVSSPKVDAQVADAVSSFHFCQPCGLECGSALAYEVHVNGERHRARLLATQASAAGSLLRIRPKLQNSPEVMVGLDQLVEFQIDTSTWHLCRLCGRVFDRSDLLVRHLGSPMHRLRFLEDKFRDLYCIASHDASHQDVRLARLDSYCQDLHDELDRGQDDCSAIQCQVFSDMEQAHAHHELQTAWASERNWQAKRREIVVAEEDAVPKPWRNALSHNLDERDRLTELPPADQLSVNTSEFIASLRDRGLLSLKRLTEEAEQSFHEEFEWVMQRLCHTEGFVRKETADTKQAESEPAVTENLAAFLQEISRTFKTEAEHEKEREAEQKAQINLPKLLTDPMQALAQLTGNSSTESCVSEAKGECSFFDGYSMSAAVTGAAAPVAAVAKEEGKGERKVASRRSSLLSKQRKTVGGRRMAAFADMFGLNEDSTELPTCQPFYAEPGHSGGSSSVYSTPNTTVTASGSLLLALNSGITSHPSMLPPIAAPYEAYMRNGSFSNELQRQHPSIQQAMLLSNLMQFSAASTCGSISSPSNAFANM